MNGMKRNEKYMDSSEMSAVSQKIIELCSPHLIYLYNHKVNSKNELSSFKLCVVANTDDKFACERNIYMEADCEIPFDILIYTPEEWERLHSKNGSFANRICDTGTVIYYG